MKFEIGFCNKRFKSGKIKDTFKVRRIYKFIKYNYQLLNNEDYIFSKTNEILDIFFKNTYLSKDKEFFKKIEI